MVFCDEDLKLMKIQMYEPDQSVQFHWPGEKLKALLARLEAAEKVCVFQVIEHNPMRHDFEKDEKRCATCEALKAWRKVSGQ